MKLPAHTPNKLVSRFIKYSLFISAWVMMVALPVHAVEEVGNVSLVVSPPRYDLELKPGESAQKTIKITNNAGGRDLTLKVMAIDFIVQDSNGTPIKVSEAASGRFLASPWFTLESEEVVVKPGEQKMVSVIITAPSDALPGGHYAGVFFEPVESQNLSSNVSYTGAQVGTLFGITIAGDIRYDALIKEFRPKMNIYEYGPVEFVTTIENQSDTHIRPVSSITIHDMLGRKLDSLSLDQVNIFPFTSRSLVGNWDQVWGLGRYTATLSVVYGTGSSVERTIFFWIMPWRIIAAIAIVIAVLLVIIISTRRHLQHRQDNRDQEIDDLKRKIVELENRR